ncbi:MAG: MobA/MobL family protein, partial [Nocardioidaceae bacterium]
DTRNHHAHILVTTRRLGAEGFTDKTRELDDKKTKEVDRWRERWADLTNERLREGGSSARVDHRSLKEQGIDRVPTTHLGPGASGFERRTGEPSRRRLDSQREITERLAAAKAQGDLERQKEQAHRRIIEISEDLNKARAVAKQDRELQTKLTRLENTLDLSEKAGIPITDTERAWLDRDRKELATFRAQHGINEAVTDKPQLGQLTKLDTPEERLRAAREAGEKERQQLGNQVERTRGPEDAQERLRAAREAGEREREEERERPRSRAMRER